MAATPPDQQLNVSSLGPMVRSWVHFDNLAATFQRQAQQARSARFRWETQIIDFLKQNRMTNAILQIAGGRLTVHEEKHANPLTLQRLEMILHEYYAQNHSGSEDETAEILKFIRANRGSTLETRLKKS
jgi:hypothetical protein